MPICLIMPEVSPMILWESSQKWEEGGGGGRGKAPAYLLERKEQTN